MLVLWGPLAAVATEPLRAGIIGCDTSHVVVFTQLINAASATGPRADVEVVAAYPGGSDDLPASRDRLQGFVEKLKGMDVEIVDSIDELLNKVDVVLLESVDGRKHLEQARPVLASGKPVFIDKPLAGSLADAVRIVNLADKHNAPWFSSSSLRFCAPTEIADEASIGKLTGCNVFGPCDLEKHHPDFFWYGIHGVECLFTFMGPGCETVSRTHTDGTDIAVGVWKDGRVGVFRGLRQGAKANGVTVFGDEAIKSASDFGGYEQLVDEICKFFVTREPPVKPEVTLEILAFMEAADESKRRDGVAVRLDESLETAREAANK
jgi:hypothetical protein